MQVSNIGAESRDKVMPYLHLDLPGKFPPAQKRELAARLCRLYTDVMQTQIWRPNVGIAELGEDNLFHLGADGLEPIVMVLVEFRAGQAQRVQAQACGRHRRRMRGGPEGASAMGAGRIHAACR
jgi:phenylpyruvate tautomerase PptA (4-oxalocrotonate tautomerase family)